MTLRARFAVAPAVAAAVLLVPTTATAAPAAPAARAAASARAAVDAPTVEFTKIAEWAAGYVGQMTLRNGGTSPIDGWRVEFDLPPGTRITSSFSAIFRRTGDHYVVTNAAWNARLAPGASITFGWVAEGHGAPRNCTLNGARCDGTPLDVTPPSRPGPLTADTTTGYVLTWAPSTDDRGPVRYEVYDTGSLIGTTTDTRHVVSSGPYLPPKVYIFAVRAVDAAGNPSPYSFLPLGGAWADEPPVAPAAPRVEPAGAGLLRLSWTAPPERSPFQFAPVAGYQVYVDGAPAGQTGATSLVVPAPTAGAHTFAVRTIDAVDRLSAPAEVAYEVR